jgi:hypothetical protein
MAKLIMERVIPGDIPLEIPECLKSGAGVISVAQY